MSEQQQPKTAGRGGRGAAILAALQAAQRQPGQSSQPTSVVPPPPSQAGGAGVTPLEPEKGATSAGASPVPTPGRGLMLSRLLMAQKSQTGSSSASSSQPPPKGRGRAEIIQALHVADTTRPGAVPMTSCSQSSGSGEGTSSLPEGMERLSITQEKEPVIKHGEVGNRFPASANWIRLNLETNKAVFEYEVKFDPQVDALKHRFQLLNSQMDRLGNTKSFDGAKLWLPIELPREVTVLHGKSTLTGENIKIMVIFRRKTSMDKTTQLYNVLFNRIMKELKMSRVGFSWYAPGGAVLVPQHKLEIWPGYVTGVHYQEDGVMLSLDVSHRVLRCQTIYDLFADISRERRGPFKDAAIKAVVGSCVLTRYNNKAYRVDDILFEQTASSTFTDHKGAEISYIQYYKDAYGIKITDPQQPLLLHKVKKKELREQGQTKVLCLIPELCYMTGLTDDMRQDFRVMKDLAQHTRVTPNARQASLRSFIKNVNDSDAAKKILSDWGLTLQDDTIQMDGRVLPYETIFFNEKSVPGTEKADWGREATREKVITPVDLNPRGWIVLFIQRDEAKANSFVNMMRQVTRSMGIRVGDPTLIRLNDDRIETYVSNIKKNYHQNLQMAVVIFPTQREDKYSAVKRICCVELCLPSQCIISRTISNESKLRSVTQKIALQINCKLGGELWGVKIPMQGLMVCGVDVYHDPTRRGSSVVAFISSMNQMLTKWYSNVIFQNPGEEVINGLKISLLEALRMYHKIHHSLPRSIIVYRDGVSDGALNLTQDHEVPQLATIFQNFEAYEPKLSFVVVQKRINTRVFLKTGNGMDNPIPGSVVDHTITKRNWYDFLLVSQHVRQGTVSPTHYIVVLDGGLKVDNMQRLTYKLTHLYYNWPGTVRVPAPCQYAHKLAYLIGQNVKKAPAAGLCDKLFFL